MLAILQQNKKKAVHAMTTGEGRFDNIIIILLLNKYQIVTSLISYSFYWHST